MSADAPKGLAKISWDDPVSGEKREFVLTEGATVTIGRSQNNEVCIREQHVSRNHAVISYQYGIFTISDLGSANGTFVNDQQITEPYPLASGDVIRLYVPTIYFTSVVTPEDEERALRTGSFILRTDHTARPRLNITTGAQEGMVIPLLKDVVTIGRATENATWDIGIEDRAVSRPHAKIERIDARWYLSDMGSSNGTLLNNKLVKERAELSDGSVIMIGQTTILFRLGGS